MTRHGLTLLEVVLATALLALAATGVASAIAGITQGHENPVGLQGSDTVRLDQLSAIVNELVRSPTAYGFDAAGMAAGGEVLLPVRDLDLTITARGRGGHDQEGMWFEFASGNQSVARWLRVQEDIRQSGAGGAP